MDSHNHERSLLFNSDLNVDHVELGWQSLGQVNNAVDVVDAMDDVVDNDVVVNGEVVVDGDVAPGVTAIATD